MPLLEVCSLRLAILRRRSSRRKSTDRIPKRGLPFPGSARQEAFRQGLGELGYVEGKNIAIEYRYAEGKVDRLPALAAELVRLKVDIIVTAAGSQPALPRKRLLRFPSLWRTMAILLKAGSSTVWRDLVETLLDWQTLTRISGKRLELVKEIIPKLSRVAVRGLQPFRAKTQTLKEVELAAKASGVKLQYNIDVLSPKDFETAFRAASKGSADAVLVLSRYLWSILIEHRL